MKHFSEVYKRPFYRRGVKVFTVNGNMAFDFPLSLLKALFPNPYPWSEEEMDNLVSVLNDEDRLGCSWTNLTYDSNKTSITMLGATILVIRGWGGLTAPVSLDGIGGGLGLSPDEASAIQEEFANWIISKLS